MFSINFCMKPNKAYKDHLFEGREKNFGFFHLFEPCNQCLRNFTRAKTNERLTNSLICTTNICMTSLAREERTNVLLFRTFLVNLSRNYKGLYRPVMMSIFSSGLFTSLIDFVIKIQIQTNIVAV